MKTVIVLIAVLLATDATAARRALLIGINDYAPGRAPLPPGREWPTLYGAVNDVHLFQEVLVASYGFARADVVTLTDHEATRDAILQKLEQHLLAPAAKDDVVFFYYAGHGSQVRNSRSDEPDGLDESIVPADSRLGAPDLRDKELRRVFNRILDRGARLTVMMDNCHSGSGARGLPTGAIARGIQPDPRDVRDATDYGPRPESRGALVLSATQDFDRAWEIRDAEGQMHGVFTWAWLRALRDAPGGESASDTFLRADARMRYETPFQEPVLAGTSAVRLAPFLGTRTDRRGERTVVAVEKVRSDGTVMLQGGWANGLTLGTELRGAAGFSPPWLSPAPGGLKPAAPRVVVTAMRGLARSEGRIVEGNTHSGALLEVATWSAPQARPLRLWIPHAKADLTLARRLAAAAAKRGLRWIDDPTEAAAMHLLRWNDGAWESIAPDGARRVAHDPLALIARLRAGASLYVQFPGPVEAIAVDGVVSVTRADEADYLLAGRYSNGRLSYAWVRPAMTHGNRSALPVRSEWVTSAAALREHAQRLRKIQLWHSLEPPPGTRTPYRLALRRERVFVSDGTLIGDERYELVARAASQTMQPRYLYAFVIDSHGTSTLLYPRDGSVENRLAGGRSQVSLGELVIAPPYGLDTFVLLTTDEPLPNPWILAWDGVRGGPFEAGQWSIERVVFESVPPRRH